MLVDDAIIEYEETGTTFAERTLRIPVPGGTEVIEIFGSQVIPEFGILAALVLAAAVGTILVLGRKNRLQNTPTRLA